MGLGSMSGPRENSEKCNKKITQPLKKVPILRWFPGLGSMSGSRENSEKCNKKITQPLKKVPILRWLSSTSQARSIY
jgi:hypothetical protein